MVSTARALGVGDTIVAIASPAGAGARGVLRLSGPSAWSAVAALCGRDLERRRGVHDAMLVVLGQPVAAMLLTMPAPRSYTGEDVVELHLPGAPLLLAQVMERLLAGGEPGALRVALPGEFTQRAFENGRLALAQAEAVAALIEASSREEHRFAFAALQGELGREVAAIRSLVLDARALLESGLDFEAGETGDVPAALWQPLLAAAAQRLTTLRAALPRTRPVGDLALLGAANAGKSSLANALAGRELVLVADAPGTTRDVLRIELAPGLALLDAPGDLAAPGPLDAAALAHRDRLLQGAGGALLVVDPRGPQRLPDARGLPVVAVVATRADLPVAADWVERAAGAVPCFRVDARHGKGALAALRALLLAQPSGSSGSGLRIAGLLREAHESIARAQSAAGEELVAVELADAAERLHAIDGGGDDDAVLDRIFRRFCLGK